MGTIILYGIVRNIIDIIINNIALMIIGWEKIKIDPELLYSYKKKKNDRSIHIGDNSFSDTIITIIIRTLYFVPFLHIGDILFILNGLSTIVYSAVLIKHLKENKEKLKFHKDYKSPEYQTKELEKGEEEYKNMVDSLRLDGLEEKEIKSFMKNASKENEYLKEDNSKKITESNQRKENLMLLRELSEYLKSPYVAYCLTLNKKIQNAYINEDTLNLEVSEIGIEEEEKFKTYSLKLKNNNGNKDND